MDKETIRKAVLANRGGLTEATDSQLKTIWNSLDEATKEKYVESVKQSKDEHRTANKERRIEERKDKDAVSDTTKRNL